MKTYNTVASLIGLSILTSLNVYAQTSEVVKIGSAEPTSGAIAHLGIDNENGAKLAIDDINSRGDLVIAGKKIKLLLVAEDDGGDPKYGPVAALKLINKGIVAAVGHLNSGVSIPANDVYSGFGVTQISPSSTNPDYTLNSKKTPSGLVSSYRVVAHDSLQMPALMNHIVKFSKIKTAATIDDGSQYGEANILEAAYALIGNDVEIISDQTIKSNARGYSRGMTLTKTDFEPFLSSLKTNQPDLIVYGGMDSEAAKLAIQMKQLGIKSQLASVDGACTNGFITLAGSAGENMFCVISGEPIEKMPNGKDFEQHYEQSFLGKKVQIYAPFAYDAVYAIVEAMKIANSTTREAITAAMPKVDFEGVTGRIHFDKNGDIINGPLTIYRVVNQKLVAQEVVR